MERKKILIIHGPNLNLLGERETDIYGNITLEEINQELERRVKDKVELEFFQSNYEGEIVEKIQDTEADIIIINPAAFTHTSVALRDALRARAIPFIEVHLSNIYSREPFRRKSLLSDIALGVISGLGEFSYIYALNFALKFLKITSS